MLLVIYFTIIFSRGIFEVYASKTVGYVAGITALSLIVSYFFIRALYIGSFSIERRWANTAFCIIFVIYTSATILSLVLTSVRHPALLEIGIMYSSLHILWIAALWFLLNNGSIPFSRYKWLILVLLFWLSGGGILELVGILPVPIRPTYEGYLRLVGPTGAKQHFSYSLAVLSMLAYWIAQREGNVLYRVLAWIGAVVTFISLTRNGMFVIIMTILLYQISDWRHLLVRGMVTISGAAILLVAILHYVPEFGVVLAERAATMAAPSAPGNPGRFEAWIRGLEAWMRGPILVGDSVGRYSQAGARLGLVESQHFESAIFQQLGNFGIIGLTSFVSCLLSFIVLIRDRLLKILSFVMFLVFGFYPGSESLPFIACWFLVAMAASIR